MVAVHRAAAIFHHIHGIASVVVVGESDAAVVWQPEEISQMRRELESCAEKIAVRKVHSFGECEEVEVRSKLEVL